MTQSRNVISEQKPENLRLKAACQVLISHFLRDEDKYIGRWSPSVCITAILWFYAPWINFLLFSIIKNVHNCAFACRDNAPLKHKLKLITQTQRYFSEPQPHTIHSTRKKKSLHWLSRAHPLHYLAILSQLLIDLFLQQHKVVSSHPVQSRNSFKSHITVSSLTHFIQACSHCTLYFLKTCYNQRVDVSTLWKA